METSKSDLFNPECLNYNRLGELYVESVKDFVVALGNNTALEELVKKSMTIADLLSKMEQANKKRFISNRDLFA